MFQEAKRINPQSFRWGHYRVRSTKKGFLRGKLGFDIREKGIRRNRGRNARGEKNKIHETFRKLWKRSGERKGTFSVHHEGKGKRSVQIHREEKGPGKNMGKTPMVSIRKLAPGHLSLHKNLRKDEGGWQMRNLREWHPRGGDSA